MASSIFTDVIQMGLFSVLLLVILGSIFSAESSFTVHDVASSGSWSFEMGLNLLFAAVLQSLSYPFHDPVLTDRGFLSSPKITLKSFLWAGVIGALCIVLFSLVGVYAQTKGMQGQAAVEVGKAFAIVILLVINLIMITSAASTLDSTFSSFSVAFFNLKSPVQAFCSMVKRLRVIFTRSTSAFAATPAAVCNSCHTPFLTTVSWR